MSLLTRSDTHKRMHSHTFFQSTRNAKHDYDSKYPFSQNWNKKENVRRKKLMKGKLSSFFPVTHTHKHTGIQAVSAVCWTIELVFVSLRFEWMRRARLDWCLESFVLISPYFIQFSFKGKYFSTRCSKHLVKSHLMAGEIAIDIKSYDVRKCRPTNCF